MRAFLFLPCLNWMQAVGLLFLTSFVQDIIEGRMVAATISIALALICIVGGTIALVSPDHADNDAAGAPEGSTLPAEWETAFQKQQDDVQLPFEFFEWMGEAISRKLRK